MNNQGANVPPAAPGAPPAAPGAAAPGAAAPAAPGAGAVPVMDAAQLAAMLQNIHILAQTAGVMVQGAARAGTTRPKLNLFKRGSSHLWRAWRRRFYMVANENGWNDAQQRVNLAAAMDEEANQAVQDIDYNAPGMTIELLLNAYENRFMPQAAGAVARAEFKTARQLPGETVVDWHTRAREAFLRAHPQANAELDQNLIDCYVEGLSDPTIRDYTMDQQPATYAAALHAAEIKYANVVRGSQIRAAAQEGTGGAGGGVNAFRRDFDRRDNNRRDDRRDDRRDNQRDNRDNPAPRRNDNGRQPKRILGQCWICGDPSHVRNNCPALEKAKAFMEERDRRMQRGNNNDQRNGGRAPDRGDRRDGRGQQGQGRGRQDRRVNALEGDYFDGEYEYEDAHLPAEN